MAPVEVTRRSAADSHKGHGNFMRCLLHAQIPRGSQQDCFMPLRCEIYPAWKINN